MCRSCALAASSDFGADSCDVCKPRFYRPDATAGVDQCERCSNLLGAICPWNTTLASLELEFGFWRHSQYTNESWRCIEANGVSPCRGGADAGVDGNGYCHEGHHGPRCELCSNRYYFDSSSAQCKPCGDLVGKGFAVAVFVLGAFAAVGALTAVVQRRRLPKNRALRQIVKNVHYFRKLWHAAGMQTKLKLGLGLFQCVSAAPSVFGVSVPDGGSEYGNLFDLLKKPATIGFDFILPGSCYGSYRNRLILNALWPFVLVLMTTVGGVAWELAHLPRAKRNASTALVRGLQRTLPLVLVLSFTLLPSQSTRILRTFLCDRFRFDDRTGATKRYLQDDYSLSCDLTEYDSVVGVSIVLLMIWPVAIPALYVVLLWLVHKELLSGKSSRLSRAISFLHIDYGT